MALQNLLQPEQGRRREGRCVRKEEGHGVLLAPHNPEGRVQRCSTFIC